MWLCVSVIKYGLFYFSDPSKVYNFFYVLLKTDKQMDPCINYLFTNLVQITYMTVLIHDIFI